MRSERKVHLAEDMADFDAIIIPYSKFARKPATAILWIIHERSRVVRLKKHIQIYTNNK